MPQNGVSRIAGLDWPGVEASLDTQGFARLPALLDPHECRALADLYTHDASFRSRIDMSRFRFGVGEYKYFAAPLPPLVQSLREELYTRLASIANRWLTRLAPPKSEVRSQKFGGKSEGSDFRLPPSGLRASPYPPTLADFLAQCRRAGQTRPTPLLLSYAAGGYNCLHQDIYGELAFPLQVVFALSCPETDYQGGEFLLVEQRPRAQSRGHAVRIAQGAGIVFATRERPVAGTRGDYRTRMRHGVSTVTDGSRMTLGIIFHDAK